MLSVLFIFLETRSVMINGEAAGLFSRNRMLWRSRQYSSYLER